MTMTCLEAFAAYEAVRHRLPVVSPGGAGAQADNLDEIAEQFDVFLLDAFGVLNIGESAIPDTPARVAGLQAAGKRVLVVTNAASVPRSGLLTKYTKLGYEFAPEDVISSRRAALKGVSRLPAVRWGVMLHQSLGSEELDHLDLAWLQDDPLIYDQVEGFLMLGSAGWTEERQAMLENSVRQNPRRIIVGNPDIIAPRETGFSLEPGYYAHLLADRTGAEPEFFGKPFGNIYDEVFQHLDPDIDRSRVLMVGDSLHTDILGGAGAGVKTALIKGYGFFQGHDTTGPVTASGIRPDYILNKP